MKSTTCKTCSSQEIIIVVGMRLKTIYSFTEDPDALTVGCYRPDQSFTSLYSFISDATDPACFIPYRANLPLQLLNQLARKQSLGFGVVRKSTSIFDRIINLISNVREPERAALQHKRSSLQQLRNAAQLRNAPPAHTAVGHPLRLSLRMYLMICRPWRRRPCHLSHSSCL